jgi:tRNA 2-thiouridine synthesizing protein D
MKFALLLRSGEAGTHRAALGFARAALAAGHDLVQIFFHADAVHFANRLAAPPQEEMNPAAEWSRFEAETNTQLILCSTAGLRRGVREANLAPGFRIDGVGRWLEAATACDRVVSFGG